MPPLDAPEHAGQARVDVRAARVAALHRSTGRWRLGLALALVTALIWGLLPMALQVLVRTMYAATLTWARFLGAGLLVTASGARVPWRSRRRGWPVYGLLGVATLGLAGNYALYLAGLRLTSPSTAQLVSQLGPLFLMAGAILVFRERFGPQQWLGVGVLLAGLALYFVGRLVGPADAVRSAVSGALLVAAGSASWAAYALAQKQLLRDLPPDSVLLVVYLGGALLLWPAARPSLLLVQSWPQLLLLAVTAVVTLVGYRCFSGALEHLEGARVGVVLSLTPLVTVSSVAAASCLVPGLVPPEHLGATGLGGALLVVTGSVLAALARRT